MSVKKEYLELTRLIERLHRRFLDLLRAELNRLGIRDINSVQALLLANIGDENIAIRDLVERGYYQGSNVSYNIKKLAEMGYLEQERSAHDRRSVSIRLTDKALKVVEEIRELEHRIAGQLDEEEFGRTQIETVCQALRRVERTWTDYVHYGRVFEAANERSRSGEKLESMLAE
jgi:DNA-binding MarR family transcriptional regulator